MNVGQRHATGSHVSVSNEIEPHLETLTRCADLMSTCVAHTRLYGTTHPESVRSVGTLHDHLDKCFEDFGTMEWIAKLDGFFLDAKRFSLEKEDRPGLAHYLHMEGIQSLRLDPGLTHDELTRLLVALRTNFQLPEFEEDTLESILFQSEFEHVGFEAVNPIMDAEALSGRFPENTSTELLERLIELGEERAKDIADTFGARDPITGARIDQATMIEDNTDWDTFLMETADEDAEFSRKWRVALDQERPSDYVARLGGLLVRSVAAMDPVLPPNRALALADGAVKQLYQLGDASSLVAFLEDGSRVVGPSEETVPGSGQAVKGLLKQSLIPRRLPHMMRSLSLREERDIGAFQRLASLLSTDVLIALLEGALRDAAAGRDGGHAKLLWSTHSPRLLQAINAPDAAPEVVVAVVQTMGLAGASIPTELRQSLLQHRSALVRGAVLPLLKDRLEPDEVKTVTDLLLDRVATVRKAAVEVLGKHRPPQAWRYLQRTLEDPNFHDHDPNAKTDLCVAAARVAGPAAVDTLEELLNVRFALIPEARLATTIEAAAFGLAAARSPHAQRILERGSRSWSGGPRRAACQAALAGSAVSGDITGDA